MPIGIGTIVFAHDFVYAVLNESWAPAIVPMQILAVYGVIRSVAANMGVIFQAGGKPQWLASIATWRFVTMAVLLYPFILWGGLVGVSVLSAGVAVVDFVISAFLVDKVLDARMATYARIGGPMLLYALLAGALGYLVNAGLLALGVWDVAALLAGGAVLVLVYGLLTWWRDDQLRPEINRALAALRRRARPAGQA
jgi:O-antigen/teichoic acid export membrane protein